MSLAPKKDRSRDRGGALRLGDVSDRYTSSRSRHEERGDVALDIESGELVGGHISSRHRHKSKKRRSRDVDNQWNCGGWLPWINILLIIVLFVLLLLFYLHWNGAGGETVLARMERGERPETYLIPKPQVVMEGMRELYHNHTRRIIFDVNVEPGKFARYPPVGHIEGLDPSTIGEHRLCCHVNERLFICDYGQGASTNMGLECVVEYEKESKEAHLRIVIQSREMKGARCAFRWTTLEPTEILTSEGKKVEEEEKKSETDSKDEGVAETAQDET